jgi:hypothetical protein
MYQLELKYQNTQVETLSFDSYDEFASAYWAAMSDPKVSSYQVV